MNNWWEGVLYSFIEESMDIYHKDVMGIFWTEVDTPADYKRLTDWASSPPPTQAPSPVFATESVSSGRVLLQQR